MKHVITITGIRPDFIRMSKIFKKLDKNFKHTLIHTGQHYDKELSDVFFKDLDIREPDFNWGIGQDSSDHLEQLAHLLLKIKEYEELIRSADLVLFLGDSNSVLASIAIKKMGIKVGHIEAGMRSGDKRMQEEINRTVCDHCSDFLFVYHENYAEKLRNEGITKGVHVVGNTILEVIEELYEDHFLYKDKTNEHILMDIHRPENFLDKQRLKNIIYCANFYQEKCKIPVYLLAFKRMTEKLKEFEIELGSVKLIPQMGLLDYLTMAYNAKFVISDSGTAQEELAILRTPILVPREYTERPESYSHSCSVWLPVNTYSIVALATRLEESEKLEFDLSWLGSGNTSREIVKILREVL